ncbi:4Fe-4S dicluster domain-containing protein [Candidatus Thorarchaeota archaeon]|nr:MAG: 4Fe-4S dicluster domain-containing protein [Candidatus Thorarchaeota archaeon]
MPIDRAYREEWEAREEHAGHKVWFSPAQPDSLIHGTRVGVLVEACNGCMRCMKVCPVDVFKPWTTPTGNRVVDPVGETDCILCLVCETVCPTDAIDILQEQGSDETLNSLLRGSD